MLQTKLPEPTRRESSQSSRKIKVFGRCLAFEEDFRVKANLKSMLAICVFALSLSVGSEAYAKEAQSRILYGANPSAGHYLEMDDAKIYYETYGSGGTPLVLLQRRSIWVYRRIR
jgi:hypothetical protein